MAADKDEIRARSDIVEVIGTAVALKKRGRNHVGLCPFHQEKTASFNVDPVTQTFKCFGCGAGGDVFTFVERYQNMTFVEAAEHLARRAGLEFERKGGPSKEQQSERDRMLALNELAAGYYEDWLKKVEPARAYLANRGLSMETVQRFRLGFAPDNSEGLADHLQMRKQDLGLAVTAGLLKRGDHGYFDMFWNRIMFPILDEQERIVAFGGRSFGGQDPKYLNTGETPLFAKSKLLYGLPLARRKIASEGRTLLMEGYTDVIAAHQAGFLNAVATLGTSLTEEHARRLARLAPTVVLVYDGDSAGIKATLRASEILEKEGVQVRVAQLPNGEDPDSLLTKGDISKFQAAIDRALGRVEYQLGRIVEGVEHKDDSARQLMLRQIVEILASIPTRSERDVYVSKVWRFHPMSSHGPSVASEQLHRDAELRAGKRSGRRVDMQVPDSRTGWTGRTSRTTRDELPARWREDAGGRRVERFRRPAGPIEAPPKVEAGPTSEERAERELVRALAEPEWRSVALKHLNVDDLLTDDARRFALFVQSNLGALEAPDSSLAIVLDRAEDAEFSLRIRQQLQEISALAVKVPVNEAAIKDCAETLRRHREIELVQRRLSDLLQSKPELSAEDRERVREYQSLLRQRKGSAPSEGGQERH